MSVIPSSIRMVFTGQSGNLTLEQASYRTTWLCKCSSRRDNQAMVCNFFASFLGTTFVSGGLLGDGSNTLAKMKGLQANRVPETGLWWFVEGDWETPTKDNNQSTPSGETSDDPTDWKERVERGSSTLMRPVEKCKIITDLPAIGRPANSEGPAVNAAGEILDPGLERIESITIYRVTKNLKACPADQLDQYENAINSDTFTIKKPGLTRTFKPYTVFFQPAPCSLLWHRKQDGNEISYWSVGYELHHNKHGWRQEVVNRGNCRRFLPGDPNGKGGSVSAADIQQGMPFLKRITDADDVPTGPVLLDLNGQPLRAGQPATYITYAVQDELPFKPLKI